MKLINQTLVYLSSILFVTAGLWGVLLYYQLLNQVKTTVDDGLANYKLMLINNLKDDSLIVQSSSFKENSYIIRSISEELALRIRDSYKDTLIYSDLKNINYQSRLLTTAFISADNNYYEMKVISQELDKGQLIKEITTSLLWLFLFLLVSTILINNFVLKKTWKPFYLLLKRLDEFQLEKGLIDEPGETRIREFSLLNKSVSKLLKSNTDTFNSQKQFIENASHELQTPLAIGINKLELLAGEKELSASHIQKISDIVEILRRLSGLNKSLLLLSKIENRQFIAEDQLSIDEITRKVLDSFSDFSEYRQIKINYQINDSWFVKINSDLAEILIMNLVKNAIINNRQGGELNIKLSQGYFTIENTSDEPEIPAVKLFERFSRNQKNNGSTGLGLAIVKAITEASNLSVTYSFNGKHAFKVASSVK